MKYKKKNQFYKKLKENLGCFGAGILGVSMWAGLFCLAIIGGTQRNHHGFLLGMLLFICRYVLWIILQIGLFPIVIVVDICALFKGVLSLKDVLWNGYEVHIGLTFYFDGWIKVFIIFVVMVFLEEFLKFLFLLFSMFFRRISKIFRVKTSL